MIRFPQPRFASRHPARLRALLWVLLALAAAGPGFCDVTTKKETKKDRKKPQLYIPEANAGAAKFVEGGTVDIEISASAATVKQVEFLIRTPPQNGVLSAVRPHPRDTNKGVVTYTHHGHGAPLTDSFSFACRVDGGPVSAPATVTLTGRRYEPKLEVVDISALDKVFLGGESSLRFSLKNAGAAPFAGDFKWPPPWKGPAHIGLKPGETALYDVEFKPDGAGVFRFDMMLQPGVPGSKLPLYGECMSALTVTPGRLALEFNPATGAREGSLTLVNARVEPLHALMRVPPRLEGVKETIDVPGLKKVELKLRLAPADVKPYADQLTVISTQGPQVVVIEAKATPANLVLVAPADGTLDLGAVAAGSGGHGVIQVKNSGGLSALVEGTALRPLSVRSPTHAVRIEPGETASFEIAAEAVQPGEVRGEVRIGEEPSQLRVPVTMNVHAVVPGSMAQGAAPAKPVPLRPAAAVDSGRPRSEADRNAVYHGLVAYLASSGIPVPADKINPYLGVVNEVTVLARSRTNITIGWKKPAVAPSGWMLEISSLVHASDEVPFIKMWQPLRHWKFVDSDPDKVAVRIDSLPPGAQFEIRLMGVDRDGKVSTPSTFRLTTEEPWHTPGWVWRALWVALLGTMLYVLNRIRRGDFEWRLGRSRRRASDAGARSVTTVGQPLPR